MLLSPHHSPLIQPQWQITARWDGLHLKRALGSNFNQPFLFLPFLLMNFLPEQSVTNQTVLRVWLGWKLLRYDLSLNQRQLLAQFERFRLKLLLTINDQLKSPCSITKTVDKAAVEQAPVIGKQIWSGQNFMAANSRLPLRRITLLRKQPLLIPVKCLKPGQFNSLKLAWSSRTTGFKEFPRTSKLHLRFFWPKQLTTQFNLTFNRRLTLPFFFLIRFYVEKAAQIDPLLSHQLEVKPTIGALYTVNQPFNGLFEISYIPFQKSKLLKQLVQANRNIMWRFVGKLLKDWTFNMANLVVKAQTSVMTERKRIAAKWNGHFELKKELWYPGQLLPFFFRTLACHYLQAATPTAPPRVQIPYQLKPPVFLTDNFLTKVKLQLVTQLELRTFQTWKITLFQPITITNQTLIASQLKLATQAVDFTSTYRYTLTFEQLTQLRLLRNWMELPLVKFKS